jgi:hypothetical protein
MGGMTNVESYTFDGREYSVNTGANLSPCMTPILDQIIGQLDAMLSYHSRVLVQRLDLHTDEYSAKSEKMTLIMKKIRKHLGRVYGMKRFGYVWVREMERSKKQHYHLVLFMDQHKISYPLKLVRWIEDRWAAQGQECVHRSKNMTLTRVSYLTSEMKDCVFWLSYMAKERGKNYKGDRANNFGSSRLQKK